MKDTNGPVYKIDQWVKIQLVVLQCKWSKFLLYSMGCIQSGEQNWSDLNIDQLYFRDAIALLHMQKAKGVTSCHF